MSNINFNLNNGKEDFTSLKEAIFKRAREKAEALNAEVKDSYTNDVKADIMESARVSVRNNPFMNLFEENDEKVETQPVKEFQKTEIMHSRNIDYKQSKPKRFSSKINNQLYTAAIREGAMREASETLRKNQNVLMSLKFLNTQAAIALNKPFITQDLETSPQEITFGI